MTVQETPVDDIASAPVMISAAVALEEIEAAFRKTKIKRIKKLEATIMRDDAKEWLVNITIHIPALRFPFSLFFPILMPWSFQVSGHASHSGDGEIISVTNGDTMDKGPIYVIWRCFLFDQLSASESFDDCMARISNMC